VDAVELVNELGKAYLRDQGRPESREATGLDQFRNDSHGYGETSITIQLSAMRKLYDRSSDLRHGGALGYRGARGCRGGDVEIRSQSCKY